MKTLGILVLASTALAADVAARSHKYEAAKLLAGVMTKRQNRDCGPGATCADACGPGYQECVVPGMCYNPSAGDRCCANGQYCAKGTYCSDVGCCPDGSSLEECGATATVATVAPSAAAPASTNTNAATSVASPTVIPAGSSSPAAPQPSIATGGASRIEGGWWGMGFGYVVGFLLL